jgi:hypothetical protein
VQLTSDNGAWTDAAITFLLLRERL